VQCVHWYVVDYISDEVAASIFRVVQKEEIMWKKCRQTVG